MVRHLFPSSIRIRVGLVRTALLLSSCSVLSGCVTMEDVWPHVRRPSWSADRHRLPSPRNDGWNQTGVATQPVPEFPGPPTYFPAPTTTTDAGNGALTVPQIPVPDVSVPAAPQSFEKPLAECRLQVDQLKAQMDQMASEHSTRQRSADERMQIVNQNVARLEREMDYWRSEVRRLDEKADRIHAQDIEALDGLLRMLEESNPNATATTSQGSLPTVDE